MGIHSKELLSIQSCLESSFYAQYCVCICTCTFCVCTYMYVCTYVQTLCIQLQTHFYCLPTVMAAPTPSGTVVQLWRGRVPIGLRPRAAPPMSCLGQSTLNKPSGEVCVCVRACMCVRVCDYHSSKNACCHHLLAHHQPVFLGFVSLPGAPASLVLKFRRGFPENWEHLFQKYYRSYRK